MEFSTHDGAFSLLITSSTSIRVEVGFGGPLLFGTFRITHVTLSRHPLSKMCPIYQKGYCLLT